MWKDFLFLIVLALFGYISFRLFIIPMQKAFNKNKIENFQKQSAFDAAPRTLDSLETQHASNYTPLKEDELPKILLYNNLNMLSPNTALYGKDNKAVNIKTYNSIPLSALPSLSTKQPWNLKKIEEAETPSSSEEICETSLSGIFTTCGVKGLNSACELSKILN